MILLSRCLAYRRLPSGLNGLSPDVGHVEVLRPAAGSLPQEEALGLRSLPHGKQFVSARIPSVIITTYGRRRWFMRSTLAAPSRGDAFASTGGLFASLADVDVDDVH